MNNLHEPFCWSPSRFWDNRPPSKNDSWNSFIYVGVKYWIWSTDSSSTYWPEIHCDGEHLWAKGWILPNMSKLLWILYLSKSRRILGKKDLNRAKSASTKGEFTQGEKGSEWIKIQWCNWLVRQRLTKPCEISYGLKVFWNIPLMCNNRCSQRYHFKMFPKSNSHSNV